MKKYILPIILFITLPSIAFATVFSSNQVGTSSAPGYILQTQGATSTPIWVATSTLGFTGGSGGVTSITAGTGLSGGTITTSGTINLSTPVSFANGGTGISSCSINFVLLSTGSAFNCVATSSLGISGGGGSGTVNSATSGQVAVYNTTGTAVSGTSTISISGATTTILNTLSLSSTTATNSVAGNINIGSTSLASVFTVLSSGNVGIGTSTPGSLLAVQGNAYFGGNMTATGTLSVTGQTTLATASSTGLTVTATSTLTGLKLTNLSNTFLALDPLGNLISTTTPISGGSGNSAWTVGNGLIYNATSSDKVGVGTTNPLKPFHVFGNTSNGIALFERSSASSNGGVTTFLMQADAASTVANGFGPSFDFYVLSSTTNSIGTKIAYIQSMIENNSTNSGGLQFNVSNAAATVDALELRYNGTVGIGTSTPVATFQVATSSANATTTLEFGKAGQSLGTCLKLYRSDGSAIYASVLAGATTFTLSTTACASVAGF